MKQSFLFNNRRSLLITCRKGFILIFSSLLSGLAAYSQSVPLQKIESPNAASLGIFGEVPVSKFTGTPDISIPLHTVAIGDIKVPITLRYHPSLVKPNMPPGWVGLGWNLQSYGSITRVRRGGIDEVDYDYHDSYYPSPGTTLGQSGSERVNSSNWNSPSHMAEWFQWTGRTLDVEADEFTFNVPGLSGRFFYTADGWKVVCEDPVKVEPNGFFTTAEIAGAINSYIGIRQVTRTDFDRMFSGFTITTSNGTKYIFGGIEAVEFTSAYGGGGDGDPFYANTWLLKKIVDATGNEVVFNYKRSYATCNLAFYTSEGYKDCDGDDGLNPPSYDWNNMVINTNQHGGQYQWPMYLKEISTVNESVSFETSVSNQLRYSNSFLKYQIDNTNEFSLFLINYNTDNLQIEQLDRISISNDKEDELIQFAFNYVDNPLQRLELNSLTRVGSNGNNIPYTFNYNDIGSLPEYGGNFTDHWGFYNYKDLHGISFSNLYNRKQTHPIYVTKGLLNSITYPTGGYTEFIWESHTYSKVVSAGRNNLIAASGNAGGSRIKEVRSYSKTDGIPVIKKYHYVKGFNSGTDPGTLPSSGVLNGLPQYVFNIEERTGSISGTKIQSGEKSINSQVSYSYNGEGSYIGYPEVIEENGDGSYTKFTFTSFGLDIHNISHFDKAPEGVTGWKFGEDRYLMMNSLELERGKPTGIFQFKNDDTPVKKTLFFYRNDLERFDEHIRRIKWDGSILCGNYDAVILASAFKEYNYKYYVVKKEVTKYNQYGTNPMLTTTHYSYNDLGQLRKEKIISSDGTFNESKIYYYVHDYNNATMEGTIGDLKSQNIVNSVVDSRKIKGSKVISGVVYEYNKKGQVVKEYQLESKLPIALGFDPNQFIPNTSYYQNRNNYFYGEDNNRLICYYDMAGMPTSYQWGYNASLPVVEVRNAINGKGWGVVHKTVEHGFTIYRGEESKTITFTVADNGVVGLEAGGDYDATGITLVAYSGDLGSGTLTLTYGKGCGYNSKVFYGVSPGTYTITLQPMEQNGDPTDATICGQIVYPGIAQVRSGETEFFYEGFEDDMAGTNGVANNVTVSHTGKQYYDGSTLNNSSNYTLNFTIPNNRKYIIEYWYLDASSNWQYVKKDYTANSMTLTESMIIDNIRLYPADAFMTSYTYEPLFGLTSKIDENGRVSYYDYDDLGRLRMIRDENGNIEKQYSYHYKIDE